MRRSCLILLTLALAANTYTVNWYPQASYASTSIVQVQPVHHKHPKLRKWARIAAIGALTGGVGGVILGTGAVHGAMLGAGTHVAFHSAHEKWKKHHAHHGARHHHAQRA
jgi:hypothetical protein